MIAQVGDPLVQNKTANDVLYHSTLHSRSSMNYDIHFLYVNILKIQPRQ